VFSNTITWCIETRNLRSLYIAWSSPSFQFSKQCETSPINIISLNFFSSLTMWDLHCNQLNNFHLDCNDLESSLSTPTINVFIDNHNSHCLYRQIKLSYSTIKSIPHLKLNHPKNFLHLKLNHPKKFLHLELDHPKNFNIPKPCWKFMVQLPCWFSLEVNQPSR
jgi:hypothetical protein